MAELKEICCYYIAMLRCIGMVHQNSHWLTKGDNFYSNHLLFEKIYKTAAEDADLAVEKFVGLFGNEILDLKKQAIWVGKMLKDFSSDNPHQNSLAIEKKFLTLSEKVYKAFEKSSDGTLTLGLDDALLTIASNREAAVYLLGQTQKTANKSVDLKEILKMAEKYAKNE